MKMIVKQIETFRPPSHINRRESDWNIPRAFNNYVMVKRYKMTIEEIVEPDEVVIGRLKKLYKETTNHYTRSSIASYARINYDIDLEEIEGNE
jgi:hypothetical protein